MERFSSLEELEMMDFYLGWLLPSLDIFLCHFPKLHLIFIESIGGFDFVPLSCEYVMEKRRQAFGSKRYNEDNFILNMNDKIVDIWIL